MKKKLLSMLLCLCLVCTLLPATTLAAETEYDLWVGGVQVTSANASNITGTGISGNVSYDAATKTLTLDNAKITGHKNNVGISAENGLIINLVGSNEVIGQENNGNSNYGMYIRGDLTFSGNGSLEVSAAACSTSGNTWSVAVYATGNVTVNSGCTITATCGTAGNRAAPFSCDDLILSGVKITAAKDQSGAPVENPTTRYWDLHSYTYLKLEPATVSAVSVNNGTGDGNYAEGTSVSIQANAAPAGMQFKEWSGADALTFTTGSKTSANATFTMPAQAVTLTATYETAPTNAQAPTIRQGPVGTTYEKGAAAATLKVVATSPDGGTLTYQWSKGNGITGDNIVGANASTYTPPTDTVGKWEYSCTVTNTIPDNEDGGTKTAITVCSAWIEVVEGTGGTTTPTSGGSAMLAPRATYLGEGRFETRNVTGAPIEVLVNGEPVDFTPEEDGFSLYLPYLEAGRHQLTVRWNSRRLNTYFDYEGGMELVVTIPGDMVLDPPKTGDSGALWLCTGLMLFGLSGLLLSGLVRYNRKRDH